MSESPLSLTFGARNAGFLQSAADFHKQRVKITRRVHNLKKYLRIQQTNTKNYKTLKFTAEDYSKDGKYFLITFLTAERNYLYALELLKVIDLNSTNIKSKQKLISTRYRRSLSLITDLINNYSTDDFQKRLELLIYKEVLNGHYGIVSKNWKSAITSFALTRLALQYLEDFTQDKVLYKSIIEDYVDEPLKLAIYRDSKQSSLELTQYSQLVVSGEQSHEIYKLINERDDSYLKINENESIKQISWRNYEAQVKDETTSRLLSKVFRANGHDFESYDKELTLWAEALETHNSYIGRSIQDDEEQDDQILLAYIRYSLLISRIKRDQTLISDNQKETLRILDTIETTIKEIMELPGVYSDDELLENLHSLSKYYQTVKLNLVALRFFTDKHYNKSLLLCSKSSELISTVNFTIPLEFISQQDVVKLSKSIKSLQQNSHVLSQILEELPKGKATSDDIYKFSESYENIVNLKLEPVPVKPVLFDVAFNYISYSNEGNSSSNSNSYRAQVPARNTVAAEHEAEEPKKKGFFGLFGR